jgi:heat shock protein HslJ
MKLNRITALLLLPVAAMVYFAGCSSSGSEASALAGSEWQLFEMDGIKYEPAGGKIVTISFDAAERKMGGKAPCNSYGSSYTKSSNKLSFGNIFSTEMACNELESERAYFNLLPKTFAYQISGDKLYLFDSTGMVIFRFRAKQ